MADTAIDSQAKRANVVRHQLTHYIAAALTTGTSKWEWIVPFYCKILDVICDSETANSGEATDIIDVNLNGTTIYTTQANRPTLGTANTGLFARGQAEVEELRPGDIVSFDVDQIATTGSARFKINILLGVR